MPQSKHRPTGLRGLPYKLTIGPALLVLVLASVWSQSQVEQLRGELAQERGNCRKLEGVVAERSQVTRRYTSHREVEQRAIRDLHLVATEADRVIRLEFENRRENAVPALEDLVPEAYASESAEGR